MCLRFHRLELNVDNARVTQSDHSGLQEKTEQEGEFTSCITNLYIRRCVGSSYKSEL